MATATLGISAVAKQNLENGPTTLSPAIIMGAAVPYETKTGPTEFTPKSGGALYPPYSEFRYKIITERNHNITGTHQKMSGFDGTYYFLRVDVSQLINKVPAEDRDSSYLHVKIDGNKALMVYPGPDAPEKKEGVSTFADATGKKTAAYSLKSGAASLKDKSGPDTDTPYVDVIIISSGTLVAGADTGSATAAINADFGLKFYIDTVPDYNTKLTDYTAVPNPAPTNPTWDDQWLAKYYTDDAASNASIKSSYKVMGSDLEIEVMNEEKSTPNPEFWSLRKAMGGSRYADASPIKLICEVPVLEGLRIDGGRYIKLDVNSFDIQIANHQTTGAAGLTVINGTMELTDSFNTTGAELAIGNNASMLIGSGGKFIVGEKAQLEVEYDAASTTPGSGTTPPKYECGVVTIENGGTLENFGVISIEGTEGKPVDPANPSTRDKKDAEFYIMKGGTLDNHGCLLSYGAFYNMGTLKNDGKFADVIESNDPDKGLFTYHKGIQISWKDDVTQSDVNIGRLNNGYNKDGSVNTEALLQNSGDIVLVPGLMYNFGRFENSGTFYTCPVDTAIIPLFPPAVDKPFITEEEVHFTLPIKSYFINNEGAQFINTSTGRITGATVPLKHNGRFENPIKELTKTDDLMEGLYFSNLGIFNNDGSINLDYIYDNYEMTNTGTVDGDIYVSADTDNNHQGILYDKKADPKLTEVFNASLVKDGTTNIWTYAPVKSLTVTPESQKSLGGKTVDWTIKAETQASGEGIRYAIRYDQLNIPGKRNIAKIAANQETKVTSPTLPETNGNVVYSFQVMDSSGPEITPTATVVVSSDAVNAPVAITGLEYNGKDQQLVTEGGAAQGLQYRLGTDGTWSDNIPVAKDAGTYTVYYKLKDENTERGSVDVTIAKKAVIISVNDIVRKIDEAKVKPTYSVSGVPADGVSIDDNDVTLDDSHVEIHTKGAYYIDVTVANKDTTYKNYDITVRRGCYNVTDKDFHVTAEDVKGVYGTKDGQAAYKGYNIKVTVPTKKVDDKDVATATVYYSYDPADPNNPIELTNNPADDDPTSTVVAKQGKGYYKTFGLQTLVNLPAGAGTHTVSYFVVDNTDPALYVSGTKQVIIEKATQDAPKNIGSEAENPKGSGNGYLTGLTPRKMEYRLKGGDGKYTLAEYAEVRVAPGVWLVRYPADDNHFAGVDAEVTVGSGDGITVNFDSNGGSTVPAVSGIIYGDQVAKPEDPTRGDLEFFGWYDEGKPYNFALPVIRNFTLIAYWKGDGIPTPNTLYYTGAAQELVTAPEALPAGYKEIQYALGTSADAAPTSGWSTSIPTGTATKVYYVWYKLIGEEGQADSKPECVQVRIQPTTELVPYKAPTETENGNKAYYIGNDGKLYWDALGLAEILDPNEVIIPATGKKENPLTPDSSGASNDSSGGQGRDGATGKRGLIIISSNGTRTSLMDSDPHWRIDAAGNWHYTHDNGQAARNEWIQITYNGKTDWYAFDEDGKMRMGWFYSEGNYFFLEKHPTGYQGSMVTGWKLIDGKWYYFETVPGKTQGRMYHDEVTPDGFKVGADGSWDGKPAAGR
ncbi:MAG: InlB B-repeat-containing protein [Lachnospiraceae bacterium]|nr:InlB B-repeat-containing protein [Lachnospiraceae bacterium]